LSSENDQYVLWQIRDFHIAKQEEDIGFYAGFVGKFWLFVVA